MKNIIEIEYFLIDNYEGVGNEGHGNYNTDIDNVKRDLTNIKNFKFNYIEDLLNQSSFDKVKSGLVFTHLNFGNYDTEIEFLPKIINKTKSKGVIILDYYEWYPNQVREKLDQIILDNNVKKTSLVDSEGQLDVLNDIYLAMEGFHNSLCTGLVAANHVRIFS